MNFSPTPIRRHDEPIPPSVRPEPQTGHAVDPPAGSDDRRRYPARAWPTAMHCIGPTHPQRADAEAFVARIYRERYGARLASFMPLLLAWCDSDGALQAVVGLRVCGRDALFVEQYLDVPAEAAVAAISGRPTARERIVEVGNFAACNAGDARSLILHLTVHLHAAGYRWVLFAATRQLRNAFDRLRLKPVALADADASRLAPSDTDWGRYYEEQPRLMCGDIVAGHAWLERSGLICDAARSADANAEAMRQVAP